MLNHLHSATAAVLPSLSKWPARQLPYLSAPGRQSFQRWGCRARADTDLPDRAATEKLLRATCSRRRRGHADTFCLLLRSRRGLSWSQRVSRALGSCACCPPNGTSPRAPVLEVNVPPDRSG